MRCQNFPVVTPVKLSSWFSRGYSCCILRDIPCYFPVESLSCFCLPLDFLFCFFALDLFLFVFCFGLRPLSPQHILQHPFGFPFRIYVSCFTHSFVISEICIQIVLSHISCQDCSLCTIHSPHSVLCSFYREMVCSSLFLQETINMPTGLNLFSLRLCCTIYGFRQFRPLYRITGSSGQHGTQ